MRRLLVIGLVVLLLPACGPAVPRDELGTVLERLPDVPGATGPYHVPGLESDEPAANTPGAAGVPAALPTGTDDQS